MLFFYRARLAILSEPKTGTTALVNALKGRASIMINSPPGMKHVNYSRYMAHVAPFIEAQTGLKREDYLVVSVMREPVSWLGSWYRYRARDELKDPGNPNAENYTGGMSFDDFARGVMLPGDKKPSWAKINTPCTVALKGRNLIGVDRIFPYENQSGLYALVEERTKNPLETQQQNISPEKPTTLENATLAALKQHFAFEIALHRSLKVDGQLDAEFTQGPVVPHQDEMWNGH